MKPQRSEFGTYDVREVCVAINAWIGAVSTLTTKQQELALLYARRLLHGLGETVTAKMRVSDFFRAWGSMMLDIVGKTTEIPLDVDRKQLPEDGVSVAELFRELVIAVFAPQDAERMVKAMIASMEDVMKAQEDGAAQAARIQPAELAELAATNTREQWRAAIERIKARRGGALPSDWGQRVVLAGLGTLAAERWAEQDIAATNGPYNARYELALASEVARKAPDRFPLLSEQERARVGEHTSVRVMFHFARRAPDGCVGEPMWLRSVRPSPLGGYVGKLDSKPTRFPPEVLRYDDEVAFGPEHIIQLDQSRALS